MQHYFESQPYRQHYPSLRVTNPSLPTPGPCPEQDVENRTATRIQEGYPTCRRPTGYTAAAPWLYDEGAGEGPNLGRAKSVLPNPHDVNPHDVYYDHDGHLWDTVPARETPVLPLRVEKRTYCTPLPMQEPQFSNPNPNRRFFNNHGHEMRMVQSQPSSIYSEYSTLQPSMTHAPSRFQTPSMTGHPMARSTALSSSVVRDYDDYANYRSRSARPPPPTRAYSANSSVLSSRPAFRLNVHGLSLVDEDAETSFAPAGYSQNNNLYHTGDDADVPAVYAEQPGFGSRRQPTVSQNPQWQTQTQAYTEFPNPHAHEPFTPVVTRQPRRQKNMRVVAGNRNPRNMPRAADGTREWSTDLCLFCDHNMSTWCKALWCPCIVYGRNKARVENLYAEEKVHPNHGGTCSGDCALHATLSVCLFGWAVQVPNRASVRRRYNIDGDWLGDCAAAFFCSPCELSQESRELDLEEENFGDPATWPVIER